MDFKTANCGENLNENIIYLLFRIMITLQDRTVYNIETCIFWYLSIFYLRNVSFQISNVHYVFFWLMDSPETLDLFEAHFQFC